MYVLCIRPAEAINRSPARLAGDAAGRSRIAFKSCVVSVGLRFMFRAAVVWVTKSVMHLLCNENSPKRVGIARTAARQYHRTLKAPDAWDTCVRAWCLACVGVVVAAMPPVDSARRLQKCVAEAVVAMTPSGPACSFSSTTPYAVHLGSLRLSTRRNLPERSRLAAARLVSLTARQRAFCISSSASPTLGAGGQRRPLQHARLQQLSTNGLLHGLWRNVWQRQTISGSSALNIGPNQPAHAKITRERRG